MWNKYRLAWTVLDNVLLNVEFRNVDEHRNSVVKMTISKKNNKNHFKLNATNSKF